jgi:hypothetical protein
MIPVYFLGRPAAWYLAVYAEGKDGRPTNLGAVDEQRDRPMRAPFRGNWTRQRPVPKPASAEAACPIWVPDPDAPQRCAYCECLESTHSDRAVNGPYRVLS